MAEKKRLKHVDLITGYQYTPKFITLFAFRVLDNFQ